MKRVQLRRPYFPANRRRELFKSFREILDSGRLTLGPFVKKAETSLASKVGTKHALGVTSATAGLHLAMLALDIRPGDEVVVPAKTFVSTANAVVFCGGKPIFCDVQERTMNIDPISFQRVITKKTKAVIPVHVAGQPADMDEIMETAGKHSIEVVEDSAHAPYALYRNKCAGTIGRIGVYSFYPDKVLASSDGGMVVTDDDALAEKIHLLRNCGRSNLGDPSVKIIGYNYRMNEFQAALTLQQLGLLDAMISKRRGLARFYDEHLANLEGVETPFLAPDRTHDYYAYVIRAPRIGREKLQSRLADMGVETSRMFDPVYMQDAYVRLFGSQKGLCPVTERISEETVSIPLHPALDFKDLGYVCECITSIVDSS